MDPPDSAHAQWYYPQGYYINGSPASAEVAQVMAANGLPPGYYWLDASGNWGVVGGPSQGNIRRHPSLSKRGSNGWNDGYDSSGDWTPSPRMKILETGYSLLTDIRGEESGYGLYSYALMVNYNSRSAKFLSDVLSAIPAVEDTAAQRSQTNIFYIPTRMDKVNEFPEPGNEYRNFFVSHAKDFYDFKLARSLLDHLCNPPAEEIKAICDGDLSRGPFVFTYAKPARDVTPVPPPFLFMDLSDVHERAFPEFIAAFTAQVKRDDISGNYALDKQRAWD